MINEFKTALVLSAIIHVSIFIATSYGHKSVIYLNVPVEIFFNNAPGPQVTQGDIVPKEKEKEEIKIPQKKVKEKKSKTKDKAKEKEKAIKTETKETKEVNSGKTGLTGPAHLVPSGQISLDSAKFPYSYYTSMLVKKIGRNWQWAVEFGRLKSVVYFKIQKDGTLSDVAIKETSGDALFDQQALRAIQLCDPFPPLPDEYPENNLGVFFEFSFKE